MTDKDTESDIGLRKEIYIGKTLRIFLSYSNKEKYLAGEIKNNLEKFGLEVFLAHEDIEPSKKWLEEIVHNIKSCDIFIPIISNDFKESDWTDQESGMAFIEDKIIIPLITNIIPYGFIGPYQALKLNLSYLNGTCLTIIKSINTHLQIKENLTDCIIRSFVKSFTYDDTNERVLILKELGPFTDNQINELIRGFIINNQIHSAYEARPFIKELSSKYIKSINPELLKKFNGTEI